MNELFLYLMDRKMEENEAVRMSYWMLGVGWVGGWERDLLA